MSQPPPGSGSATAEDEVWRPRPVTTLTEPTARSAPGTSAFTRVDLPTPECPTMTLIRPASASRSGRSCSSVSGCPSTTCAVPSGAYRSRMGPAGARSALVRQSSGSSPAS